MGRSECGRVSRQALFKQVILLALLGLVALGQAARADPSTEDRNTARGIAFLEGLGPDVNLAAHLRRYVASSIKQHDGRIADGRDAWRAALAAAIAKGAKWDVRHSVAEGDLVVLIGANSQPAVVSPPVIIKRDGESAAGVAGSDRSASPDTPLVGSPEENDDGSAFAVLFRFDTAGKIVEAWNFEQPFKGPGNRRSGRVNPRSIF